MKLGALLIAAALVPGVTAAQGSAEPGSELTISVMTMGPGTFVWERFGHNAIRVTDARTGSDVAYNYGMFDFAQDNFILHFIQGRMRYWMEGRETASELRSYRRANRSIWLQELNLTPAQRVALRDFLEANAREENKYYRYDYYRDNCSTRVRDALDRALGGVIQANTDTAAAGSTFRFHTRRLTENDALIYTGLQIGLSSPTDRPISRWEEMFLPLALREHLRTITVPGPDGTRQPLVRAEQTVFESSAPQPPAAPPIWWPFYLVAGLIGGALLVFWSERLATSGGSRAGFGVVGGAWSLLAGIAGSVLAFLWFFTDHQAAHANQSLFFLSPFSLPLAAMLPRLAARRGAAGRWTRVLALSVGALALAGLLWKLLPLPQQANPEILALALPLQLGIAVAIWRRAQRRSTPLAEIR